MRSVKYAIDVFPSSRNVNMRGDEVIYNPYSHPLEEIHFSLDPAHDTSIEIPGAAVTKDDTRLSYRIYRFTSALQPGEERTLRFTVQSKNRGFENNVSNPDIVQNGTFFNNRPTIGYNYLRELSDAVQRKKFGLQEFDLMPALERNCTADCRDPYFPGHSDWVDISAIISTTPDQSRNCPGIAGARMAAGWPPLLRIQTRSSLNEYVCFHLRPGYEIAREEWNGIQLEVYYLKEQPWNVSQMMNSMKKPLDYYIKNFGPYEHKEARIIEFPRVASFAQAFPGTMPYSESIGFIANLSHPDDIDSVFYVVAYEMAHQWWAHQVTGANMGGATVFLRPWRNTPLS